MIKNKFEEEYPNKLFAVVPINFDYNDEYYYAQGYDVPLKLFKKYSKAKDFLLQARAQFIKEIDSISNYVFDDLADLVDTTKFETLDDIFQEIIRITEGKWAITIEDLKYLPTVPNNLTWAHYYGLANLFSELKTHEIKLIDIDVDLSELLEQNKVVLV